MKNNVLYSIQATRAVIFAKIGSYMQESILLYRNVKMKIWMVEHEKKGETKPGRKQLRMTS